MNELKKGENYTARLVRSGTSSRGAWEIITTSDKKQKMDISVFPRNVPSGVKEGQKFNLVEICSVKNGMRKDKNDRWQPSVSIEAVVNPIESEFDTGLTGSGVDVAWEELSKEGGDPWADIEDLPL